MGGSVQERPGVRFSTVLGTGEGNKDQYGNVSRRMFTTDITSHKEWCEENHLSMQAIHTAGIGAGRRNRTADIVVTNH